MKTLLNISVSSLIALCIAFSAVLVLAPHAKAAETTIADPAPSCVQLTSDLRRGSSLAAHIKNLQKFLATKGYLNPAYSGNGSFGPLTYAAVVRYQAAEGLPQTGFVGPLTRAHINAAGCNGGITQSVTISGISPQSARIGAQVAVSGFGFTNNNTVLIDGMVAARNVPIASSIAIACTNDPSCKGGIRQTLNFTLPDNLSPNCPVGSMCPLYIRLLQPGTYKLTVSNDNGTSNAVNITVLSSSTNTLSLQSLDAPTTLPIGVQGTWTLTMNTSSTNSTLHYTVVWGDENFMTTTGIRAPDPLPISATAAITHTYTRTGTYTPTFTITDDAGHSVNASASVIVTPIY